MPRQVRRLSRSKIYHVMIRGNEKINIFLDDEDRLKFLSILTRLAGHSSSESSSRRECLLSGKKEEKKIWIYAYCLMDNHVHLLINEGEDEISRVMKRINTSYAYYFNNKYGRVGHLFQDRFKSEAIEEDNYLLAAARYIHNNPVKAGISKQAGEYRWSSCSEYLKSDSGRKIVDKSLILKIFHKDGAKARELFNEYTNSQDEDKFIEYGEQQESKLLATRQEIDRFVKNYLMQKSIGLEELNSKENVKVRNAFVIELRKKTNLSVRQIAELLGINRGVVQRIKL